MPRFEPFRGIRYDVHHLDPARVTAPPYDVISPDEREALLEEAPQNVVRIDLPLPDPTDPMSDPYATAAALFRMWRHENLLVDDDEPSFTVYRMEAPDEDGVVRHTTGVIGAMELSRPGEGGILPHEFTTPKAKSDRLDLLRSTVANLSPVWGLSPAAGLTELLECDDRPLAHFEADGVVHTVWRISDPARVEAIAAAISAEPIVIADGHHRYETSLAYRDERRADSPDGTAGGAEAVMCFVVELVDDELSVGPIHRLLSGLPDDLDLVAALEPFFTVEPFEITGAGTVRRLQAEGALGLVTADRHLAAAPPARGHGRGPRPRLQPPRRGPRLPRRRVGRLPARRRPHPQRRRQGRGPGRRAAAPRHRRPDPRDRPRRRTHAPQVHLLLPQAPNRPRLPRPPLTPAQQG